CAGLSVMLLAPVVTFSIAIREKPALPGSASAGSSTAARGITPTVARATVHVPSGYASHHDARAAEAAAATASRGAEAPIMRRPRTVYHNGLACIAPALPWPVQVWTLGICTLSLRLAGGLALIARMRRRGLQTASSDLQQRLAALARSLGLRRAIAL